MRRRADSAGPPRAADFVGLERDRVEKPDGYAVAGIPVYLLVDREACSVTAFTEPEKGTYRSATTRPFGAVVELPEPAGFALDTEKLKEYAD
ncbi:Uma2 family endonuclease [Streptomyces sp. NPDC004041]|uniref:Uma2 family endonuclease n=1 Tax=unclassified Streptomyces TaxID=2593676 RepID=UPI000933986F|nr:Uma2 family endonuclease [Streptomyces sp. NBRC 110465]